MSLRPCLTASLFAICLVPAFGGAPHVTAQDVLLSVDVFGSDQVEAADIRENWGSDFERLGEQLKNRDLDGFLRTKKNLVEAAGQSGVYSFVDIAVAEEWQPTYGIYVTVDLVDPIDIDSRMNFNPKPEGEPEDPRGLIEKWIEYEKKGTRIRDSEGMPSLSCPAFHCVWGFSHPELAEYGDYFLKHAAVEVDALRLVMTDHYSTEYRRSAVLLQTFGGSLRQLTETLMVALKDAEAPVRQVALEVLTSITEKRPDLVKVSSVVNYLNAPSTGERAAAIQLLKNLSGPLASREEILREGGLHLVKLMQLDHPGNSEPAYQLLRRASGREDLTRYQVTAWNALIDHFRTVGPVVTNN